MSHAESHEASNFAIVPLIGIFTVVPGDALTTTLYVLYSYVVVAWRILSSSGGFFFSQVIFFLLSSKSEFCLAIDAGRIYRVE